MRPRYAIPLIAGTVLAVYLILSTIEEDTKERSDPYLLLFIGLTFTGCMAITLIYTRSWTLRSAGVLLTMAGDGVLYSFSGGRHFLDIAPATLERMTDLARSCFFVGAPLLLIGLIAWIWRVREPPPEPLADPAPEPTQRSAEAP